MTSGNEPSTTVASALACMTFFVFRLLPNRGGLLGLLDLLDHRPRDQPIVRMIATRNHMFKSELVIRTSHTDTPRYRTFGHDDIDEAVGSLQSR